MYRSKRLAAKLTIKEPVLEDVMVRINNLTNSIYFNIAEEFRAIKKVYKDSGLAHFWLGQNYTYDSTNFKHRYLLGLVFEAVGLKDPFVLEYLNGITDGLVLSQIGVNRVKMGDTVFYRIRTGIHTH
jgi:hypothetical protein